VYVDVLFNSFAMLLTTGIAMCDVYVMQCSVLVLLFSALQDHTLRSMPFEHAALFDFMDGTLGTRRGECYLRPLPSARQQLFQRRRLLWLRPPRLPRRLHRRRPRLLGGRRRRRRSSSSSMKLALRCPVCALWT